MSAFSADDALGLRSSSNSVLGLRSSSNRAFGALFDFGSAERIEKLVAILEMKILERLASDFSFEQFPHIWCETRTHSHPPSDSVMVELNHFRMKRRACHQGLP